MGCVAPGEEKTVQEKDGKNSAELQTIWTKTTWKTFEKILDDA